MSIPQGKETMICQLLRQPQKDADKRIVVVEDTSQMTSRFFPTQFIFYSASLLFGRFLCRSLIPACLILADKSCVWEL